MPTSGVCYDLSQRVRGSQCEAAYLLHELPQPAVSPRAVLGNRDCWAAQTQPRGHQRGPRSKGLLQQREHISCQQPPVYAPLCQARARAIVESATILFRWPFSQAWHMRECPPGL